MKFDGEILTLDWNIVVNITFLTSEFMEQVNLGMVIK
jgi:hypothetical protein